MARDARNAALAQIHIAKQQLALDDEAYRAMLWTIARVRSAKDLDDAGRRAVLAHLKARGFKTPGGRFPGRPHNADKSPQIRKIEALLADAKLPWSYADAIASKMFHVERVAFCSGEQLSKLIAALGYNQRRKHKREAVH